MNLDPRDAEALLRMPEFMRFLSAAIHAAGIVSQHVGANGQLGRDLAWIEGRRSRGFDMLHAAHSGQHEQTRAADPDAVTTLLAALNSTLKTQGSRNDRHKSSTQRYDDALGTGDADG